MATEILCNIADSVGFSHATCEPRYFTVSAMGTGSPCVNLTCPSNNLGWRSSSVFVKLRKSQVLGLRVQGFKLKYWPNYTKSKAICKANLGQFPIPLTFNPKP